MTVSLYRRTVTAASVGWQAAYRAFTDPESVSNSQSHDARLVAYAQGWLYYRNRMFSRREGGVDWTLYLSDRELYKHTRLIYNFVPQLVDFYVDNIWQRTESENHAQLITPVSGGADETLAAAVAQIDAWTNWQSESAKAKRYAAATGNCLIEIIDDLEREKITQKIVWAGYVTNLVLNALGDVSGYTLEYPVHDSAKQTVYRYKKVVTKESFSYFRDDAAFIPAGKLATVEDNPYGFCPAVWVRHTDDGADYGLPACVNLDKVDEANSLASHLHDNIHKSIESPKVLSSDDEVLPIIGGVKEKDGRITPSDPRLHWVVLKTKAGASVHDLAGDLKLAEAHPFLKELLESFSTDYPELQAAVIVKQNSQLSGVALERMLTPAQNRLDAAAANYDRQLIKLRQMQIAIAGWRIKNGWTRKDDQQKTFAPFDLSSYEKGDLDFNLKRSLLVEQTEAEREDVLVKKANRAVALKDAVDSLEALMIAGYTKEQAKEIIERRKKEKEENPSPESKEPPPTPPISQPPKSKEQEEDAKEN